MTRRVSVYRLFSLLQLIFMGFAVVTLPLAGALATALVSVDRLTSHGQAAVLEATHAIQASRNLVEDMTAVERYARQYHVLGDTALLESYEQRRDSFLKTLGTMRRLQLGSAGMERLVQLDREAMTVFSVLKNEDSGSQVALEAIESFPGLGILARNVLHETIRSVAHEIEQMQRQATRFRQHLLWEASALIPAALLLAILFTVVIARPIHQLDQAIKSLGAGIFDRPITVSGPYDLADLGRRLNWLRIRLIELEEQKTFFMHHISHELKTPLTNIREGVALLSQDVVGRLNVEQQEIANIVCANSLDLQRLIENLLSVSLARAASPIADPREIDLDGLVREIADRHKLYARSNDVTLDLDLNGEVLCTDLDRLTTILDNLLSNAIKFTAMRSRVRVITGRIDGDVYVEVQDEGCGIPPEDRERVFELFFQGDHPGAGHIRGSGIGLYIAREYARALEGRLQVLASEKGARLQLRLPGPRSKSSGQMESPLSGAGVEG
ncbi:integral membrane sensor signal transduction histidine kinase [Thiocapsa marina 5811]|uniref:histidine kinase n=2 Tax=Thiocapsa marina TaxID=244573 RepID=F9UI46_9GAMM|nr:integral membrane sensor signal transduction histidine kinase [Thiocapsa marina 5811]